MYSFLGAEGAEGAVNSIIELFQGLVSSLSLDIILFIFAGLIALIFIVAIVRLIWCYESRAMRQMRKINKYLKDTKIGESNLVEFHNKMRKLPQRFRDRWQLFMLEREGSPSRYLTVEYCVKRPLYNSAILTVKKVIAYATIAVCVLSALFAFALVNLQASERMMTVAMLFQVFLIPLICGLFGCIFCMILQLRYTLVSNTLYEEFTIFIRNIDKSTNAMPDYVDYELLFTSKEINAGIPVLREYLEKRALEEQRLLEKAKAEEANHSPYNFADLGVNGSQLIERAVTESEKFMMSKLQIQQEITDLEKQLQKNEANMEDIEREANRKLQAIKENLERLDKAMAETTNRVEINYNRRQATEEMNKKAKLEKDLETMLGKEQVALDALKVEIQKRKEIIETQKEEVETSLKSEYDTFATKVYQELSDKVTRDNSEQMRDLEMVIARLKAKVQEYSKDLEKRDNLVEARNIEVENLRRELRKAKNLLKSGLKKGKNGHTQEDVDNMIKEPEHYDPSKVVEVPTQVQQDEFMAEPVVEQSQEFVDPNMEQQYVDQGYDQQFVDQNAFMDPAMQGGYDMPQEQYVEDIYNQNMQEVAQPVYFDENQNMEQQFVEAPVVDAGFVENVDYAQPEQVVEQQPVVEEVPVAPQSQPAEVVAEEPKEEEKKAEKKTVKKTGQVNRSVNRVTRTKKAETKTEDKKTEEEANKKAEKEIQEVKEQAEKEKQELKEQAEKEKQEAQAHAENAKAESAEMKKQVEALNSELEKSKKEIADMKEEKVAKEKDELEALQEQINAENERLKQQQEELRAQIDETLKTMEKATNATKAERTKNIKKIKDLIAQLKTEAAEAKERGASKAEINKINKSAAELLKVIADYQANKPISVNHEK